MAVKLTNPKNPLDSDTEYMDPQFLHYLNSEGYSVIEIIGGGNCLFRSIAFLVCGDQDKRVPRESCPTWLNLAQSTLKLPNCVQNYRAQEIKQELRIF